MRRASARTTAPPLSVWEDGTSDPPVPSIRSINTVKARTCTSKKVAVPKGKIVDENATIININANVNSSNGNSSSSSSSSSSNCNEDVMCGKKRDCGDVFCAKESCSSPQKMVISDAKKPKIAMSHEEKTMNGAPEGDLYDIKVLQDEELAPLEAASSEVIAQLSTILASSSQPSATWADKYATVEMIRRVIIFHSQAMQLDIVIFTASLEAAIQAIESLRSCSVRNGISCLRNMVMHCPIVLDSEYAGSLLEALMNRSATGPKFICESASEVIMATAAKMLPCVLVGALNALTLHRNSEISNLAHYLVAQSVLKAAQDAQSLNLSPLLAVLCRGLSSKRPNGRESSRMALLQLQAVLGEASFQQIAAGALTAEQIADMQIEFKKAAIASTPSASSSSSSFFPFSSSSSRPSSASRLNDLKSTAALTPRMSIKDQMLLKRSQMKSAASVDGEICPPSTVFMGI